METTPPPTFSAEQQAWLKGFMAGLASGGVVQYADGMLPPASGGPAKSSGHGTSLYSKTNPFPSPLLVNRRANKEGSEKETRHFEFNLEGSGLSYEVGDALGVCPRNQKEYVDDLLKAAGYSGEESVSLPEGGSSANLREALSVHYDCKKINRTLVEAFAERTDNLKLKQMVTDWSNTGELSKYLWGREIVDLFLEYKDVKFTPEGFVKLLKKLVPRLYSIASSIKAHPNQVHLTVAIVRYEAYGRKRKGVCSNFLAETAEKSSIPVFMHSNKNFRPPTDNNKPMIMVGPGTGIAPFRAFLEERKAIGAKGKNWLFFGDQRKASDFLYQEEFEAMLKEGSLTKLDLAFSRDQANKIYVQNRIIEQAKDLYAWLQEGASFFVCGDASRMAKDVDDALHKVIEQQGGISADAAKEYVQKLKTEKRYQRDVY
jgi:sulfite reductase (NADPH) flavoprotein alpha-component